MSIFHRSPWHPPIVAVLVAAAAAASAACAEPSVSSTASEPSVFSPEPRPANPPLLPQPFGIPQIPPQQPSSEPRVSMTDVAILYPLPSRGESTAFVRPPEGGAHGVLLPREVFAQFVPKGSLDEQAPSRYENLALIGLRLDTCYAAGQGCKSELRAVFQAVYADSDTGATLAADGALHVTYAISDKELRETMQEILAAKTHDDLASTELGPHPLLAEEGLAGPFATKLRAILLSHAGDARIARVTVYDHSYDDGADHWTFGVFDRLGGSYFPVVIPTTVGMTQTVTGTSPHTPLLSSSAFVSTGLPAKDAVTSLVSAQRPAFGTPEAQPLLGAFEAALRVENPSTHNSGTTDCVNCHLAEGAHRIGVAMYGFNEPRSLFGETRRDERTSVTNLHAFGYLKREISIMQRTANESSEAVRGFFGRGELGLR